MKYYISLFFVLFIALGTVKTQTLNGDDLHFTPRLTNFSGLDFKANEQFYDMVEGEDGILYFGNNDGVLIYDGERWQKIVLPNNSAATSLVKSNKGDIYAGGYNELGQVKKDSLGNYVFESLKDKYKLQELNFEYLWQAHFFNDVLVFRSFGELLLISDKGLTSIRPKNFFSFSGLVNGEFFAMDYGIGLMRFNAEKKGLDPVLNESPVDLNGISSFLPSRNENTFYAPTKSGNIYKVDLQKKEAVIWKSIFDEGEDEIFSAIKFKDSYLLGTRSSAVHVFNEAGEFIMNHQGFSEMVNASFVNFHVSGNNLWILKNNGLSFLEFDMPDFHLFNKAPVYDILLDLEEIYLATSTGVYSSTFDLGSDFNYNPSFTKIQGLEGQVWSVQKFKDQIFVSGHNGLFLLEQGKLTSLNVQDSFWKVLPISNTSDKFLATSYNGLYVLHHKKGVWSLGNKISGFDESSRDIIEGDSPNTFWICHGYKGVFRLKLEEGLDRAYSIEHFTDKNGLKSPFNINVTRYDNEIIFTTNTGIFTFNESEGIFVPFEPLNKILDPEFNTTKIEKKGDRTWFVQNDEFGYFENDKNEELYKSLFLNIKGKLNRSMESFIPIKNKKVLIGANDGLYLYQTKTEEDLKIYKTVISSASYYSDNFNGWIDLPLDGEAILPRKIGVLRFEFAVPGMSVSEKKQYQYQLEGIDSDWSEWSENNYKEYTFLEPGAYQLKVRSRNMIGQDGDEKTYAFEIPKAWYETEGAKFSLFILILSMISVLYLIIQKSVKDKIQKEKDIALREKRLLQLEIEQLKLKQESHQIEEQKNKLEEDLLAQQKELANYTMLLVKKKEIIFSIYEELKLFSQSLNQSNDRKRIISILSTIRQHRIGEEYMEVFDVNFERVHGDFFSRLLLINPELTKRELRICAFVKMDLSNKEIAPLLNISARGVETARYRVRKKLDVQEKNFKSYLDNLIDDMQEEG